MLKSKVSGHLRVLVGYVYDFLRYISYAKIYKSRSLSQRSYQASRNYHSLEKSLSYRMRSSQSGWYAAKQIVSLFETTTFPKSPKSEQEKIALSVLKIFSEAAPSDHPDQAKLLSFLSSFAKDEISDLGGVSTVTLAELAKGALDDPEKFFFSRRSVRDYSNRAVTKELVYRAVSLAIASPSVCNRQAWHVYYLAHREIIDKALVHQNGNRGFGHEVPCLLIVSADLEAFESGYERYQPWIDGGMFAMSLVWALHSLGVSTCCLNWSKGPRGDKEFRRDFPISDHHSIITMIAVGYPRDQIKVCASVRRSALDLVTEIDSL